MPTCKVFNAYGNILASFHTKDIGRSAVLGRGTDCDIPLKTDGTISHHQLQLRKKGNELELENIGKAILFKNGEKILEPIVISDGDVFRISSYFLVIGEKNGPSKYEFAWTFQTDNNQKRGLLWPGVNMIGCSRENEICIDNEDISRHHLKVTVEGNFVRIEKYNTSCRVQVNGKSIGNKQVEVTPSDTISLSDECSISLQEKLQKAVAKIQGGSSSSGSSHVEHSKSKPVAGMVILLIGLLLLLLLILIMQSFLL